MPENKHVRLLIIIAYVAAGYYFLTIFLTKVLALFLPFILAFIVAAISQPLKTILCDKLKIPNSFAALISLLSIISVVVLVFATLINRSAYELNNLVENVPIYIEQFQDMVNGILDRLHIAFYEMQIDATDGIDTAVSMITDTLMGAIPSITQWTLRGAGFVAAKMPQMLLFTVTFLLSCYFFTADYQKMTSVIMSRIPEKYRHKMHHIRKYAKETFGRYLRGLLIIMSVMFCLLLVGFLIVGIKYALIFAIAIALFDALPIFGMGAIMIPWGLFSMLSGNMQLGISLFVLYVILLIVRQFIEPKIIGSSLGLHPVMTLVGMYVGFKLFGAIGLIFAPIGMIPIMFVHKIGLFSIWTNDELD